MKTVVIKCERCENPIEIAAPTLGQKVTCPKCGDLNVVRTLEAAASPAAKTPDRAVAAGYPPIDGPEVPVLQLRPAMFRARPFIFTLLVLAVLGGITGSIVFFAVLPLAIAFGVLALIGVVSLISWRIKTLGEGLRITTKRIIDSEGLFSKATSEVLHKDIRNIQVRQTFLQRVLGVGSVTISTAAENEDEVSMDDVPRPDKVREVIDLYRRL